MGLPGGPGVYLDFEGDSITAGNGLSSPDFYPAQLDAALCGGVCTVENYGVSNRYIAELDGPTIDARYDAGNDANILVVLIGTNDCAFGTPAATSNAALKSFCQARQATGWTVVVGTIPAYSSAFGTEAIRLAYNAQIRADWATFADGLADIGADARIGVTGAETSSTYFQADQVHPKAAGATVVAELFLNALLGLP
jgi:lysophospholipase L1-like esterase